jgi:SRSO17 transposase
VSWRLGTKGRLKARFAAVRVRIADGPPQRIKDKGQQHLPGEEAWLIGEHRSSGEKKYYLANLPARTNLRQLAAAVKARWICEQAHQQLKEELGLDHFEVCVPKTPSALIRRRNRLCWRNDRAALFRSGRPDLAVQVEVAA